MFYIILTRLWTVVYTGFYYYFAPFFITLCLIIANMKTNDTIATDAAEAVV